MCTPYEAAFRVEWSAGYDFARFYHNCPEIDQSISRQHHTDFDTIRNARCVSRRREHSIRKSREGCPGVINNNTQQNRRDALTRSIGKLGIGRYGGCQRSAADKVSENRRGILKSEHSRDRFFLHPRFFQYFILPCSLRFYLLFEQRK